MTPTASQPNPDPAQEQSSRHWMVFAATFSVVTGLVGVMFSLISFPAGVATVIAAIACVLTAGLMWQAFHDRISRSLAGWLVATGLAIASLIFVLADDRDANEVPPVSGEQVVATPDQLPSGQSAPPPNGQPSSPPPAETMLLDELQVVDGGEEWRHGEVILDGVTYEESLTAPFARRDCSEGTFISYNLHRDWTSFNATVGVPDGAPTGSSAAFSLQADQTELHRTGSLAPGDLEEIEVSVEGVFRLTLWTYTGSCDDYVGTWGAPMVSR